MPAYVNYKLASLLLGILSIALLAYASQSLGAKSQSVHLDSSTLSTDLKSYRKVLDDISSSNNPLFSVELKEKSKTELGKIDSMISRLENSSSALEIKAEVAAPIENEKPLNSTPPTLKTNSSSSQGGSANIQNEVHKEFKKSLNNILSNPEFKSHVDKGLKL